MRTIVMQDYNVTASQCSRGAACQTTGMPRRLIGSDDWARHRHLGARPSELATQSSLEIVRSVRSPSVRLKRALSTSSV